MDAPYFEREGLKTVVVGNPALNVDFSRSDPAAFRASLGLGADDPLLLVLPGSRPSEIRRLMPVFREVMLRLGRERPGLTMAIPVADTVRAAVEDATRDLPLRFTLIGNEADKYAAMRAADLALACSGTVSTELALAGCPMVIAYRMEPLTWWIVKHYSTLRHATLFSTVAGKRIAPEFIQDDCTADNLLAEVERLLDDPAARAAQTAEQYAALDLMGRGQKPPAEKAARAVLEFLKI
jgi:lipid-A-disaccharide synthase